MSIDEYTGVYANSTHQRPVLYHAGNLSTGLLAAIFAGGDIEGLRELCDPANKSQVK